MWIPAKLECDIDVLTLSDAMTFYADAEWLKRHPEAPNLQREFVLPVETLLRDAIVAFSGGYDQSGRQQGLADLILFEIARASKLPMFLALPSDKRSSLVANMILAEPNSKMTVKEYAAAAQTSVRTLSRLFPGETGQTFDQWRQHARILTALEILSGEKMRIESVSQLLGYSNSASFCCAFRRVIGDSPLQFQQRLAQV